MDTLVFVNKFKSQAKRCALQAEREAVKPHTCVDNKREISV